MLKEYLLNVLQLELSREDQVSAISSAEDALHKISPRLPEEPNKPDMLMEPKKDKMTWSEPSPPKKMDVFNAIWYSLVTLGASAVVAFLAWRAVQIFGGETVDTLWITIGGAVAMCAAPIAIYFGKLAYDVITEPIKENKEYPIKKQWYEEELEKVEKNYKEAMTQYNKEKEKRNKDYRQLVGRYQQEKQQIIQTGMENKLVAKEAISKMKSELAKTDAILAQYYNVEIVHPKYRNVSALTAICEYLDTGRCSSLEGADGAYNIYELEHRQEMIINKLDTVIDKLEKIERNQVLMLKELQHIRSNTEVMASDIKGLLSSTQRIEALSCVTAYCSAVTAVNTAATAYFTQQIAQNTQDLKYIALGK